MRVPGTLAGEYSIEVVFDTGPLAGFMTVKHVVQVTAERLRSTDLNGEPRGLCVMPDLMCELNYLEWTPGGRLRGASYRRLLEEP